MERGPIDEKSNIVLYVAVDSSVYEFPLSDTVGNGLDSIPNGSFFFLPLECQKCKAITLLISNLQESEINPRDMGPEIFYGATEYLYCDNCSTEMVIEMDLTVYAFSWLWEVVQKENVGFVRVIGLKELIETTEAAFKRIKTLERMSRSIESQLKAAVEERKKLPSYLMAVEGEDDIEIWKQILIKSDVSLDRVAFLKYGGGLSDAVKSIKLLRSARLKSIPHKLILDSDGNWEQREKALKQEGFEKSEFHILRRKEIESYLFDKHALSKLANVPEQEAKELLSKVRGSGKESLEYVFRQLAMPLDSASKALLMRQIQNLDPELRHISAEIYSACKPRDETEEEGDPSEEF